MTKVTSSKPYLIRALYEWILDNGLTPYIMVNADIPGTKVPRQYVKDGQLILNIGPNSSSHLQMTNDRLEFKASFGGSPFNVLMPIAAVQAIYARENGQGMFFGEDIPGGGDNNGGENLPAGSDSASDDNSAAKPAPSKRPHLKIIK
jgi:stringent starvation protein B